MINKLNSVNKYNKLVTMSSYASGAYAACMAGVYAMIEYKGYVKDDLNNYFHEKGITDIIIDYYDINEEYTYLVGHKPPINSKQNESKK